MAKDLNQCNFIGHLGQDPEMRSLQNGDAVANFSIACNDGYKDKSGNMVNKVTWINIVAFRRLAEIVGQYLKKGSKVFISGKLQTRKWQDQQGQDRYTTEIVADNMQMLDSRGGSAEFSGGGMSQGSRPQGGGGQPQQPASAPPPVDGGFDDDIPF